MRMFLAVALVCVLGTVAHADDLKLGRVQGGTIRVVADEPVENLVGWTLHVATKAREMREVVIPIEVPRDISISHLEMRLSTDDDPLVGELLAATEARETYRMIVENYSDPALLEWVASTETSHQLLLHVYPVTREVPAQVTLLGVRGEPQVVSRAQSLVARHPGHKPVLAKAKNPRSLGDAFHERVPVVPESRFAARPARPQRALDRGFVEVVSDQDQLRASRIARPRIAVREGRADPRAFDEASSILPREMHEAFRADEPRAK
jgi:hypothetical protein